LFVVGGGGVAGGGGGGGGGILDAKWSRIALHSYTMWT